MPKVLKKYFIDIVIVIVSLIIALTIIFQHNANLSSLLSASVDTSELTSNPVNVEEDLIQGSPTPKYFYIVEYADLQCPYCKEFHQYMKTFIKSSYVVNGGVSWVIRHAPHLGEVSIQKAEISKCVNLVEGDLAEWKFIDESLVVVDEITFPRERYSNLFKIRDWNSDAINRCFNKNKTRSSIRDSIEIANQLEIERTPYIEFIGPDGELFFKHVGVLDSSELDAITKNIIELIE